jgi:hypothetical protein
MMRCRRAVVIEINLAMERTTEIPMNLMSMPYQTQQPDRWRFGEGFRECALDLSPSPTRRRATEQDLRMKAWVTISG